MMVMVTMSATEEEKEMEEEAQNRSLYRKLFLRRSTKRIVVVTGHHALRGEFIAKTSPTKVGVAHKQMREKKTALGDDTVVHGFYSLPCDGDESRLHLASAPRIRADSTFTTTHYWLRLRGTHPGRATGWISSSSRRARSFSSRRSPYDPVGAVNAVS